MIVAAALLTGGCATTQPGPSKVYSGNYFYNFETSSFTPDGTDESWYLSGNLGQAELASNGPGDPRDTAHIVVLGALSPPGHYCNLGASKYVLTVNEVLEVSDRRVQEPQGVPPLSAQADARTAPQTKRTNRNAGN
jgi:hypothetical protein